MSTTSASEHVIEHPDRSVAQLSRFESARLPKRDFLLLPLLSLLTVLVLFGVSEVVTRVLWPAEYSSACLVADPVQGYRFKPNCTVRGKIPESPWITYHYNECGYRSANSCGPKPPGTIRIAILGSSMSQALHVSYDDAFFSRAAVSLGRLCDRRIDVQNLGVPGSSPAYADRHVQEALALNPDVVLYMVVPYDLNQPILPRGLSELAGPALAVSTDAIQPPVSPLNRLEHLVIQSRTCSWPSTSFFRTEKLISAHTLMYGDRADYLRQPFTPVWQRRFADFDVTIGDIEERLRHAGVPLVIVAVPSRAEAALLTSSELPEHVDPFAFGRAIQTIAARHGAGYVDLMGPISRIPNAEDLYYAVDGHLTSEGHEGDCSCAFTEIARWQCAGLFSLCFATKRGTEAITLATASLQFLAYALAIIVMFNLSPSVAWRQFVLLAASIGFLAFFSHRPA